MGPHHRYSSSSSPSDVNVTEGDAAFPRGLDRAHCPRPIIPPQELEEWEEGEEALPSIADGKPMHRHCEHGKAPKAIISYYRYSSLLAATSLHIANLAQAASETVGERNLANIRFLTPEAAVGHTVDVVHFMACQPRYSSDLAPEGHQLEQGQRSFSLTRASEELCVWVSKMDLAEEEYTRKLQRCAKPTTIDFQQIDIVEAARRLFNIQIRWEQATPVSKRISWL